MMVFLSGLVKSWRGEIPLDAAYRKILAPEQRLTL
jgi:hypothetical protein